MEKCYIGRLTLCLLFWVAGLCYSNKEQCPPDRHYFTNCTDPCIQGESTVTCVSNPAAECKPEYCGGCVPRFYDEYNEEVHCEKEDGIICEMKTHTIGCEQKQVISILWANYGRTSKTTCTHPYDTEALHADTNCRALDSMSVIQTLCHGKRECTITVDNKLFKKDPCYGVYKYLEVQYKCVPTESQDGGKTSAGNPVTLHMNVITSVLIFTIITLY